MKILIANDEEKLVEPIKDRLERENYSVDFALDGLDGLDKAKSGIYDLIILDVMLPYKDGFTILKELKQNILYRSVWGDDIAMSNNLEVYIPFVRKKLETIESNVTIRSVRGLGYFRRARNYIKLRSG